GAEMGVRGGPQNRGPEAQFAGDSLPGVRIDRVGGYSEGRRRPAEPGTRCLLPRVLRLEGGGAIPLSRRGRARRSDGVAPVPLPRMPSLRSRGDRTGVLLVRQAGGEDD